MTPTGKELFNSYDFWTKRYSDQNQYINRLRERRWCMPEERFIELLDSANYVLTYILCRKVELSALYADLH